MSDENHKGSAVFRCRARARHVSTHGDIAIIQARPENRAGIVFNAGQYAVLSWDNADPLPYSFACAPSAFAENGCLEFHLPAAALSPPELLPGSSPRSSPESSIGSPPDLPPGSSIGAPTAKGQKPWDMMIEGPYGKAHWRQDHTGPLIAIGGGSGLAPLKAIIEENLYDHDASKALHLYHGVRGPRALYLSDYFHRMAERYPRFSYTPVVAPSHHRRGGDALWRVVMTDWPDISGCKAYIAGPRAMVDFMCARLLGHGADKGDIHSDGVA